MQRVVICIILVSLMLTLAVSAAAQGGDPDTLLDTDKDGLTDVQEQEIGTDLKNPDTDGDGVPDGVEVYLHALFGVRLNPLERDTLERRVGWQRPDPGRALWADNLWDVYDYDLKEPLPTEAWMQWGNTIDMVGASATTAPLAAQGAPQPQPPKPKSEPSASSGPCSSVWVQLYHDVLDGPGKEYGPNTSTTGMNTGLFRTTDGRSFLEVSSPTAWRVFFYEDHVVVENASAIDRKLEVVYRDECKDQPTVKTLQIAPKSKGVINLRGVNAAVTYDGPGDSFDIVMTEGTFELEGGEQLPLIVPANSNTSLAIQVDSAGAITSQEVPLNEANQRFPPLFRSLSFFVWMLQPIPENMENIDIMAWVAMLDLDSNPTTGLTAEAANNPMYSRLGADAYVPVYLQADGTLAGEIVFHDGQTEVGTFPVEVEITPNRDGVYIHVPLNVLIEQSAVLGVPFAPDMLSWRVATVFHGPDGDAKDIFPDVGDAVGVEPQPSSPVTPAGTQYRYSHSITDGGPVVAFEGNTVSGDPNIPITGWLWDFGDGTTSTEQHPQHSYQDAGTYTVMITYTFANEATWSTSFPVTVDRGSGAPPSGESVSPVLTIVCTATALQNANLRGGPGTDYAQVGSVAVGDWFQVIGINATGDWYKLRLEGIDSVWIAAFLITELTCPDGITQPLMSE